MHSRRPLEIHTEPQLIRSQPREYMRPAPGPDDFAVEVLNLRVQSTDRYVSPTKQVENYVNHAIGSVTLEDMHGLLLMRLGSNALPGLRFRNAAGSQPALVLRCTELSTGLPNPICQGDAHFDEDNVAFSVVFSAHRLAQWQAIVTAVHQLAQSWR